VEGTGSYGAALARYLRAEGVTVVEVDRPDRRSRRRCGKSDPLDAYAAARAALAGSAAGVPKTRDGAVEAIRALRVARRSAVKARTQVINQLKALLLIGPAELREKLRHVSTAALIGTCARLRPTGSLTDPQHATKLALRRLARRHQYLTEEITAADAELKGLVTATAPRLLTLLGVGVEVAGQLLTTAGDNPERLHSEAAFAHLCGVAPIPASSGKTHRHRLNRGGDRAANTALYTVVLTLPALRPPYQPLRGTTDQRRIEQTGDHPLPQALPRPRNLSGAGQPAPFLVVLAASKSGTSASTLKHRDTGSGHHSALRRVELGLVVGAGVTVRAAGLTRSFRTLTIRQG
jgi:transposase